MFDLVDSSIRRGPNSIVFGKFFRLNYLGPGSCLELETYRPFELGSTSFKSIRHELRSETVSGRVSGIVLNRSGKAIFDD